MMILRLLLPVLLIRYLEDRDSMASVIKLLDHPEWVVRVQAVNALGRLAGPAELDQLIRMLSDSN